MKVLLIRHAKAGDKAAWARAGRPDELRPLTTHGRKKMRKAAKGLRKLVPRIDVMAMSPLVRAVETAALVHRRYKRARVFERRELAPGQPVQDLALWLNRQGRKKTIALIGHEPGLGEALAWFLTGKCRSILPLKKGSASLVEFDSSVGPGRARLLWSLPPKHLRKLAAR